MVIFEKILKLIRQLLPTGRAFRMPSSGDLDKLFKGLAKSDERAVQAAKSVLDSVLPDNDNFTEEDATINEKRYGLINSTATLEERKLAILRKIAHPGDIRPRQHYLYIQDQLRAAGFDVYVHENLFFYGDGSYLNYTPEEISGGVLENVQHGDMQHGDFQHDGVIDDKVVNYIEEYFDRSFSVGGTFMFTFFIGGAYAGIYANVSLSRKNEFRQLILKLKPAHTVAYLFINYI